MLSIRNFRAFAASLHRCVRQEEQAREDPDVYSPNELVNGTIVKRTGDLKSSRNIKFTESGQPAKRNTRQVP